MKRSLTLIVATAALTAMAVTGVAMAGNRPIPALKPNTVYQSEVSSALPGNVDAMQQALNAASPVRFRVLVIDDTGGEDRTDYLDRMADTWGLPAADQLYLVIFTGGNYDLRFYMGANFRAHGVTVNEMLGLVRAKYFAKSQKGDVAGGLADLVAAVTERMGGAKAAPAPAKPAPAPAKPAPAPAKPVVTVPDPLGDGPRWSAAMQVTLAKDLMTAYLNQYIGADVAETERVGSFRLHDDKIYPKTDDLQRMLFEITFDVLPAAKNTTWTADNGTLADDGWVNGKTVALTAVRDGKVWKLEQLVPVK